MTESIPEGAELESRMDAIFAVAFDEATGARARVGANGVPVVDPRLFCPYYRRNREDVKRWLGARLGPKPAAILAAALDALCP